MFLTRYHDPVALFRAAAAALGARDQATVVSLCDPVSLRAFKRSLVAVFTQPTPQPFPTVEQYLASSPGMTRDAAEFTVAQWHRSHDLSTRLRESFVGIEDLATLEAMPAEQVFVAWLEGHSPYRRLDQMLAMHTITADDSEPLRSAAAMFWQYRTLGVIHDGDRIAYVVHRYGMDGAEPPSGVDAEWAATVPADERALAEDLAQCALSSPDMQACRRQLDGTWLLIADDDFFQMQRGLYFGFEDLVDDDAADEASRAHDA